MCKRVFLRLVEQEKNPDFWKEWAQRTLKNALTLQDLNKNIAKNIILFLGDGKLCNLWILSWNILCGYRMLKWIVISVHW